MDGQRHIRFATTRWTLLGRLHSTDDAEREAAMQGLSRLYWPPIYSYFRTRGADPERAEESAQAFFVDVVLRRDLFGRARRDLGRLRFLILSALRNFDIDQARRRQARRRRLPISLDTQREESLIGQGPVVSPEAAFDRRWAVGVIQEGLDRCERHFMASGRGAHWAAFEARVLGPATGISAQAPLARVAADLGFASPAAAAAAVQVVRKRLLVLLRELVGGGTGTARPDDIAALRVF